MMQQLKHNITRQVSKKPAISAAPYPMSVLISHSCFLFFVPVVCHSTESESWLFIDNLN